MIRAAEANIARATDKTIVIPGHGPVGDKSGLIEFRDMLVTIRVRLRPSRSRGNLSMKLSPRHPPPTTMRSGAFLHQWQNIHRPRLRRVSDLLSHDRTVIRLCCCMKPT